MDDLTALRKGREALCRILAAYPIGGEVYRLANICLDEFSDVAEALTGDRQALKTEGMRMPLTRDT